MNRTVLLAALLLCAVARLGHAEVYKWTDAKGNLHATMNLEDVPPEHREAALRAAAAPPKEPKDACDHLPAPRPGQRVQTPDECRLMRDLTERQRAASAASNWSSGAERSRKVREALERIDREDAQWEQRNKLLESQASIKEKQREAVERNPDRYRVTGHNSEDKSVVDVAREQEKRSKDALEQHQRERPR
jgi:hypothetical protein